MYPLSVDVQVMIVEQTEYDEVVTCDHRSIVTFIFSLLLIPEAGVVVYVK